MQIKGRFNHYNITVADLDRSIAFYEKALGLKEKRRRHAEDGSFTLVFMGEDYTDFLLELTYLHDRKEPYNLGDNEMHLCFVIDNDYNETKAFHKEMGCICYDNEKMDLYFIEDPDGYWTEIKK